MLKAGSSSPYEVELVVLDSEVYPCVELCSPATGDLSDHNKNTLPGKAYASDTPNCALCNSDL